MSRAIASMLLIALTCLAGCNSSNQHSAEVKSYLTSYWQTTLAATTTHDMARLENVATGEELKRLLNARSAFSRDYDIPLVAVHVLQILEYTGTCTQAETRITYGGEEEWQQAGIHEYVILLREDDLWKVAFREEIVPRGEFTPTDSPTKNCADFEK